MLMLLLLPQIAIVAALIAIFVYGILHTSNWIKTMLTSIGVTITAGLLAIPIIYCIGKYLLHFEPSDLTIVPGMAAIPIGLIAGLSTPLIISRRTKKAVIEASA